MPYLNGKKVSNAEWIAAKNAGNKPGWKEAFGYNDGSEESAEESAPVVESAPARTRRPRTRKAQTEAAVAAVTGLDIDLDDDESSEESTTEESE